MKNFLNWNNDPNKNGLNAAEVRVEDLVASLSPEGLQTPARRDVIDTYGVPLCYCLADKKLNNCNAFDGNNIRTVAKQIQPVLGLWRDDLVFSDIAQSLLVLNPHLKTGIIVAGITLAVLTDQETRKNNGVVSGDLKNWYEQLVASLYNVRE